MMLLVDDIESYRTSIALCAVHSSILLNSAILAAHGKATKFQDHSQAVSALNSLCADRKIENTNGVQHLGWLIKEKSRISYEPARLDDNLVAKARDKADRFTRWAATQFKEVLRAATVS